MTIYPNNTKVNQKYPKNIAIHKIFIYSTITSMSVMDFTPIRSPMKTIR